MSTMSTKTEITTMDGESVSAESALTLNWDRVLSAKLASPRHLQEPIQGILYGLRMHPMNYAVANRETPGAAKFNQLIGTIRVRSRNGDVPDLWIPYLTALANWQERQAPKAEAPEPTTSNALTAAKNVAAENVRKAVERKQKKLDAEAAQAKALNELVPPAVKAERAAREAREAKADEILETFVLGKAYVNSNSRPTELIAGNLVLPLTTPWSFMDELESDGVDPSAQEVEVPCSFCGERHNLSEVFSFTMQRDGDEKSVTLNVMQLLFVPALTAVTEDESGRKTGGNLYTFIKGERKGEPKKLSTIACSRCVSKAKRLGKQELAESLRPFAQNLLQQVLTVKLKRDAEKQEERNTETTLKASFAERMSRKGSRRRDRDDE